jgi:hypothetical protein
VQWLKKSDGDFPGWVAMKKIPEAIDSANWNAVSLAISDWEYESGDEDQDNFHSGCTGIAERQFWFSLVVGCTRDENQTRHGFSRIFTDQANLR